LPQRITQTGKRDGEPLQAHGRALASAHEDLIPIIQARLGRQHAALLATPREEANGEVSWSTNLGGALTPASALPEDERLALQQRAERMLNDIRGLGRQLRGEGPASQLVGEMIEAAATLPPGDWLYSVEGRPVLVMWGHAAPGTPAAGAAAALGAAAIVPSSTSVGAMAPPIAAATPPAVPAPAAAAVSAGATSTLAPPPSPGPSKPRSRWPWAVAGLLLAALLLAGWFAWEWKRRSAEDADRAARLKQAEDANLALEAQIRQRKAEQPQFQCVPDPPAPPASVPQPAPPPASAPEPPASAPEPPPPASAPASKPEPKPPAKREPKPPKPAASAAQPKPAASAPQPAPIPPVASAPVPTPPAPKVACKPRQPGDEPEVVLIIDASGSMREPFGGSGSRLDAAKSGAASMIRGLPRDVEVGLIDFSACGKVRRDKFYSAPERGALIGEINSLSPQQGTPLADALRRAGGVISRSAEGVVVVVSDGDDSCGGDPCATARALKASRPNVTINVIDLSDTPADRQVLQCVARAGGGAVLRPGDPLDLNRKLKEAAGTANCPP